MWQAVVLGFLAGVFAVNAIPHFVKGVTQEHFPTVFGSGPVVNVTAGWGSFLIGALLLVAADAAQHPAAAAGGGAAAGGLLMGLFHARVGAVGKRPPARACASAQRARTPVRAGARTTSARAARGRSAGGV